MRATAMAQMANTQQLMALYNISKDLYDADKFKSVMEGHMSRFAKCNEFDVNKYTENSDDSSAGSDSSSRCDEE